MRLGRSAANTNSVYRQFEVNDGDENPDELLELTFGMFSDDRAQFRIVGSSFIDTRGDDRTELVDVDGDFALTADYDTCNTNSIGHIVLEEGLHAFEGVHTEAGGNAGWQIWWGEGFLEGAGDPMVPLTIPQILPANSGLALVGLDVAPWPGDADGDGHTDAADLNILGLNWQTTVAGGIADADFNLDGFVDASDLNVIGSNWRTSAPEGQHHAAAVPEPSSIALLLAGLLAACGYLRKHA